MTTSSSSQPFETLRNTASYQSHQLLAELTLEKLIECYPTIAAHPDGKTILSKALSHITRRAETTLGNGFDNIYKESEIEQKLKQLDDIIREAEQRKAAYKPPDATDENTTVAAGSSAATGASTTNTSELTTANRGQPVSISAISTDPTEAPVDFGELDPQAVVEAHMRHVKLTYIKQLQSRLDTVRQNNKDLADQIRANHDAMTDICQSIDSKCERLAHALQATHQLPSQLDIQNKLQSKWQSINP